MWSGGWGRETKEHRPEYRRDEPKASGGFVSRETRTPFKGRRCIDLAIVTDDRDVIATESIIHDPLSLGDSSIPTCNWDQRLSGSAHRVPPRFHLVACTPFVHPCPFFAFAFGDGGVRAVAIFVLRELKHRGPAIPRFLPLRFPIDDFQVHESGLDRLYLAILRE